MESFFVLATWLDVMAISACAGVLACVLWVVPRYAPGHYPTRLWVGFGAALAWLAAASVVLLASRTMEFSGAGFSGLSTYLPLVVSKTHYGLIWKARIFAVVVLWLCWLAGLSARARPYAAWLAMAVLLVVVYSRSATGHAGDHGAYSLGVWVDCVHVWSSGIWVGGLFAMSLLVFPALIKEGVTGQALAADVFSRLSVVAGAALAAIVLSGVFNAWNGLDSVGNLWNSGYGRILSIKLVLVAWMVYLGGHNRYHKVPALRLSSGLDSGRASGMGLRVPGWRPVSTTRGGNHVMARCVRAVHIESVLGVLVLALAAWLHHGMPPSDMRHMGFAPAPVVAPAPGHTGRA
ncbi:hypothetical protein BJI67_13725 [Acidihalobacter aeolianus]|uniref:Copper resistance protein D n=1 Tax=Acidihalobacter aeolianus TaxID=2792603 RepID=A0A1D8KAM1_9GAMM|nr:CopD family protein [Acidihalobacter aeolianus]AOV17977.1 hypothetical protein BJI67_13725 [Acidihalobacter aeolianus]